MLYIIFQVVTVKIREKKHTFSKTFFKVEIKPPDMKEMLLRLQLISWSGKNKRVSVKQLSDKS